MNSAERNVSRDGICVVGGLPEGVLKPMTSLRVNENTLHDPQSDAQVYT